MNLRLRDWRSVGVNSDWSSRYGSPATANRRATNFRFPYGRLAGVRLSTGDGPL